MAHHQDIGGKSPGSTPARRERDLPGGAADPAAEALRRRAQPNETFFAMLRANVRIPDMFEGDLGAQLAACHTGARASARPRSRNTGRQRSSRPSTELLDYAERLTRLAIEQIPDGEYRFDDYLDNDGDGLDRRSRSRRRSRSGAPTSTSTSPAAIPRSGGLNCVAVLDDVRRLLRGPRDHRRRRSRTTTAATGRSRPPAARARSSTRCRRPPVSARTVTFKRIVDTLFGALAPAVPDR